MNEGRPPASAWVQRATRKIVAMIDEPGQSTGHLSIPFEEETTMLKTISAALLAVSVVAAPVMAAGSSKTTQAPAAKSAQVKPNKLNANAKMSKPHVKHVRHPSVSKKVSTIKTHQTKATIKHAPTTKRG
jgi:hypothetical protein